MAESRHHHWIPQFYLRGFTAPDGKLTVADIATDRFFETNPRNVAGERDFNRLEIEGHEPDALEKKLAGFEAEVAGSIKRVSESHKFEGDDRRNILNLIALIAVRSPQMREHVRKMGEETMKKMLSLNLATKQRWEKLEADMAAAGKGPPPGEPKLTYEQMKEFNEKGEYDIFLNRGYHIGLELKMHDPVLHALNARKWTLRTTDDEAGVFVTTNRPVLLTYNNPLNVPAIYRNSPGFGIPDTEVQFPLTQHLTLTGTFEGTDAVVKSDTALVAKANTKMIHTAFGQVYAPKRSVPHLGLDLKPYHDDDFLERYAPLKRKKPDEGTT